MTDLPEVKLKALVNFPASADGRTGITVVKVGGRFFLDLDYADFQITPTVSVGDMPNSYNLIWNEVTRTFAKVPFVLQATAGVASLGGQTGALSIDGSLYFAGSTLGVVGNASLFNTRASAIAAFIPAPITSILVRRYTSSDPLSDAPYKRGAGVASFVDALGNTWSLDLSGSILNPYWFGAKGDGAADDTTALQGAITAAQAIGGIVNLGVGSFRITSSLLISARVTLLGAGYQGDQAGGFNGHGVTQSTGFLGSVIVAPTTIHAIVATTDDALQLRDFQITYPGGANAGITAVKIQALAGSTHGNTQSVIERLMITGAYYGIDLENCLTFTLINNQILYCIGGNIIVNSPNWPSFNQASIVGNELWGADNVGFQFHIQVTAGGDLRISDNKLSGGGFSNGVALFGQSSGAQNMEPLVIVGNSMEGQANSICLNTANASFGVSQVVITGNQLWGGDKAILVNTFGTAKWFSGWTITGNVIAVNGGASKCPIQIDNAAIGVITGNTFNLAGGGSISTGVILGTHTTNINVQSNVYDPGFTTKVSDLGAANTVGGGSP